MKKSKKLLSIVLAVALVASINWGYFTQLLVLTKDAAIECVAGGSSAGAALAVELQDISVSKFFDFSADDFITGIWKHVTDSDDGDEDIGVVEDDIFDSTTEETVSDITTEIDAKRRYTEKEIKEILENIKGEGFKNNPLRQAYEEEVQALEEYGERLFESGKSEEEVARILNQERRDLGEKYKDATPQPLRDYIYEINIKRYGDKLGPTYDWLVNQKKATNIDIINSASHPNSDIDKLLAGFEEWLRRQ